MKDERNEQGLVLFCSYSRLHQGSLASLAHLSAFSLADRCCSLRAGYCGCSSSCRRPGGSSASPGSIAACDLLVGFAVDFVLAGTAVGFEIVAGAHNIAAVGN